MKVGELRKQLAEYEPKDLIEIAVECYKLIPKQKKEDNQLDHFISNPSKTKAKRPKKTKSLIPLNDLEFLVTEFVEQARAKNYISPNREVSKKERSTWRFKVSKWVKELTNIKREDANVEIQTELLIKLYTLLCEACGVVYFTAYDTFESIRVEQTVFYKSILTLIEESKGKLDLVDRGITILVENNLNRYTLYQNLMEEYISSLPIPDLKYRAISSIESHLNRLKVELNKSGNNSNVSSMSDFTKPSKEYQYDTLVKLGTRLFFSLNEIEEGVAFFTTHFSENDKEMKMYILIKILLDFDFNDTIYSQLDLAIKNKFPLRKSLRELYDSLKNSNKGTVRF